MLKGGLFRKTGLAWVVLVIGLLATTFICLQIKKDIEQAAVRQFAFTCDQVTLKIQERLGAYALILRGGGALFAASVSVERKEWQAFVEKLQAAQSVPGLQGVGFVEAIPTDLLAAHIVRIRGGGLPDYTVRPLGERALYTPVVYLEPFRGDNLRALGYDMYTEPVRRATLEQARDTGEAILSGKVESVHEIGADNQAEVLMVVPVYRNGAAVDTVEQRRSALVGWVYSPCRMNELITGILDDRANHEGRTVDLAIYDGHEAVSVSLLFDSQPAITPELHSLLYQQRAINYNGHQWLLVFDHTEHSFAINYLQAWIALTCGFVLSGLLFGLMRAVLNTQANALRIADKLTEESLLREQISKEKELFKRNILNSMEAEIVVLDRDGVIQMTNEPWQRFALENGIKPGKQTLHTDVGANYLEICRAGAELGLDATSLHAAEGIQAVLNGSMHSFSMEYPCHTSMQERWFMMTVLPLAGDANSGVVITHFNISERKRLEEAVNESRNLLLTIINTAPIRVFWKDLNLRYLGCNRAFAKDAGVTHPQDIIGKDDYQMGWSTQAEFYRADDRAVMESGIAKLYYIEPQTTPDGRSIWLRSSKVPLKNQDNEVFGILGIYEDITEHKQMEDALQRSETKFRTLYDSASDAVMLLSEKRFFDCNKATMVLFGCATLEEFCAYHPAELSPQKQPCGTDSMTLANRHIATAIKNGNCQFEWVHKRIDTGKTFITEVLLSSMELEDNIVLLASVRDISERITVQQALVRQLELVRQAEETLRITNEEQRAIFDSVTSGIAFIKDRIVVRCNRKLEDILGYPADGLSGTPKRLLYPDDAAYQISGKEVVKDNFRFEQQLIRKDGSVFWARISGQALDNENPAKGIVEIIEDITFEREAAQVMLNAKEMAEEAARIKSEFLVNMSHEIRTPMSGVLGMLDLLRETDMTPVQIDWLDMAHSSGETLLGIINDILDMSKLEAGKVDVEQIDFNLVDLVDNICAAMAGQAHAKGLELNCSLPVDLPLRWQGDPLRIRQVLTNLIGNAVKFTAQGEVSVSVTPSVLADSQNELRFEVRDTGIGISAAAQSQLFKSFSQADSSTSRSFGGSGLGLFISKKLVELMEGAIGVDSLLGKGACFWFTLPLVPSAGVETVVPSYEPYDPSGKRVLIVDDNETSRNILCIYMRRWGMAVDEADNGNAALIQLQPSALRGVSYDLIVLDREMPEMDGLTLAKCLAQIPALAKIPIILLSSGEQLSLTDYQDTRIVQCLMKPVRQLQLFEAIVHALQGDLTRTPKPLRAELKRTSYQGKKVLVVEDNKINQKVIVAKLAQYGIVPELAENGRLALDKLINNVYDLILMDCQMPIMDGYTATRELRLLEARQGIPHQIVIALTANALEGEREKCLAAGMDDYLSKPLVTEQLTAMLANRLGNQPAEIALPLSVAPASSDQAIWDATAALDNLDGDSALLDSMIALFLTEGPIQLSELVKFQAEGNLPALANAAHAIKGAVSYFFPVSAKDCASLLEKTARSGQSADYQGMTDALINAVTELINNLRLVKNSTNPG